MYGWTVYFTGQFKSGQSKYEGELKKNEIGGFHINIPYIDEVAIVDLIDVIFYK
jgi:hypothetical protein